MLYHFGGLFDAWGKQIIAGIAWELVRESVELDGGPTRAGVHSASPLPPGRRRFRSPEALAGHNDVDFRIPPSHAARRDLIQQAVAVVLGIPYGEADVSEKVGVGDFVVRCHGKLFQKFRLAQTTMKQIVDFRFQNRHSAIENRKSLDSPPSQRSFVRPQWPATCLRIGPGPVQRAGASWRHNV